MSIVILVGRANFLETEDLKHYTNRILINNYLREFCYAENIWCRFICPCQ